MTKFYTSVERDRNNMLVRGYHDNGSQITDIDSFRPTLFIRTNNKTSTGYTLFGEHNVHLRPYTFQSVSDAHKHINNSNEYFSGNSNWQMQYITETFPEREETFNHDYLNIVSLDIETKSDEGFPLPADAAYPILTIALTTSREKNTVYLWGYEDFSKENTLHKDLNVKYTKCKDEFDLFTKFLLFWTKDHPDIITGWNTRWYDMPYIINRAKNLGITDITKLSPWQIIKERIVKKFNKEEQRYHIYGVIDFDYRELFQKFAYSYNPQESYRLNDIAHVVLGDQKISYEEYGTLHELYKRNYQKFVDYNITDVLLVDRLDAKLNLIDLGLMMGYHAGINHEQIFQPTIVWDGIVYNHLYDRGIVVPMKDRNFFNRQTNFNLEGGHVKDPISGKHNNVCSFDINSLYPHLIIQYNMGPDTIINNAIQDITPEGLLDTEKIEATNIDNLTIAGNGQLFDKTRKGVFASIVEEMYNERAETKAKQFKLRKAKDLSQDTSLQNKQMMLKISLNSLYGAMANQYFRYFDPRISSAITASGRLAIQSMEKAINNYLNHLLETQDEDYVVAGDTDSCYVTLEKFMQRIHWDNSQSTEQKLEIINKLCNDHLQPAIEAEFDRIANLTNCDANKLVAAREVIGECGVWTKKKRYMINVIDDEGVVHNEPKIKIVGFDAIKSSTPQICRNKLRESYKLILNSETSAEVWEFINDFRSDYRNLRVEEIASPRGATDINKYYDPETIFKKGTPIHVRGSLLYNHYVEQHKLQNKYRAIVNGDRIKYVYMKVPNCIGHENVLAFPDDFFPYDINENINQYIDYELQFEKTFLQPITLILEYMGWAKQTQDIMGFFDDALIAAA